MDKPGGHPRGRAPGGGPGGTARRDITDHYVTGTRLRLRRVTGGGRSEPEYNLTQKVPAPVQGPVRGPITNLYLSRAEYDLLRAALPAAEPSKTRLSFRPYVVVRPAPPRPGSGRGRVRRGRRPRRRLGEMLGQTAYFMTRSPTRGSAASTCLAALPLTARYALMIVGRFDLEAMSSVIDSRSSETCGPRLAR